MTVYTGGCRICVIPSINGDIQTRLCQYGYTGEVNTVIRENALVAPGLPRAFV
jgi:hypothetical protein